MGGENAFDLPDAYRDTRTAEDTAWDAMRALGGGVVDPFGMTSWAAGKAGYPNAAARMQEWRGLNPTVANAGSAWASAMTPFAVGTIPGNIAMFGARTGLPIWARETAQLGGLLVAPVAPLATNDKLQELINMLGGDNMRRPVNAQARYPKGGF